MDINSVTTLIGSLGFPIAACCVMFYQNSKLQETLNELSKTLTSMNERLTDIETNFKTLEKEHSI